jgi:hypothetical protein
MHFDRYDVCAAYYVFAMLHQHQSHKCPLRLVIYRLGNMGYIPNRNVERGNLTTTNSQNIFDNLVKQWEQKPCCNNHMQNQKRNQDSLHGGHYL